MKTTNHTPGPWRIGDAGHTVFGPKTSEPAPATITSRLDATPRVSLGERKANLHLIAAAPDLLAALELACDELDGDTDRYGLVRKLAAAIAKARGGA